MARRQSTSNARIRRSRALDKSGESHERKRLIGLLRSPAGFMEFDTEPDPTQHSIEQTIENERGRLSRAQSILKCLHSALVQAEERDSGEPAYADAADIALRLIRESVHRLDSVYVKPLIGSAARRKGANEKSPASAPSTNKGHALHK